MARQAGNGWSARSRALGSSACSVTAPAAAIDVSGVYVSQVTFLMAVPCTLTFAQTGTALTITGPCDFVGTIYTFDLAGTVDTMTGALSLNGRLLGLCEDPGEFTMVGSGDGEVFSGTVSCGSASSPVTGTKCGNGVIDASRGLRGREHGGGDCCSPVCRFDRGRRRVHGGRGRHAPRDVCDGAGTVSRIRRHRVGAPCETDFNVCTDDACDAGGQCLHVHRTPARATT